MTTHFLTDPAEHQASLEAKKAWAWMMKTQARTMQKWLEIGQGFLIGLEREDLLADRPAFLVRQLGQFGDDISGTHGCTIRADGEGRNGP